jgi:hypothetical protein
MKNILKMLFGGDFQSGVYDNGGKVDTKLSIAEVEKIAKATANALGSGFSVTKGSVDTGTFDLDFMGEKYDGGSYLILNNGDVVNVALRGRPIYYNYKTKKKFEFGGDFQAGVYAKGGTLVELNKKVKSYDKPIEYRGSMYATIYGANYRDTVVGTQKGEVYWTSENKELLKKINKEVFNSVGSIMPYSKREPNIFILSVELSKININYEFGGDFQAGVYNKGGAVTNERRYVNKGEDYEVRYSKPRPKRKGYKGLRSFDEGGNIDLTDDNKLKLRKPAMPEKKLTEAEWMAKHNDSKEARTYGFGGSVKDSVDKHPIFVVSMYDKLSENKVILLLDKYQVKYEIISKQLVRDSRPILKILFNIKESKNPQELKSKIWDLESENIKITSHPMNPFTYASGGGVGLIGNQKRIDMNKNGKIDAEDFKLLRSSMNGAWRNERKHVNHNEDYEVRYAKKKPSRTGYKGKRKFGEGGGISNFERLSRVVAKNYEGKRVKPQYQKEYGKVYSKAEAKEVGNKVAGKMKMMKKAESGAEVKKANRGGVMVLAKKIRKEGESWKDALKRAGQQLK